MNPSDIVLAHFPLGGSGGRKLRPVLVLTGPLGTVPEHVVAYISSVVPTHLMPTDLVLDPTIPAFTSTKLKALSIVRLHKLSAIHSRDAIRRLGRLAPVMMSEVLVRLKLVFGL